jgi:hypothetical protein
MSMMERYGDWIDGTILEPFGEPFWHAVVRLIASVTVLVTVITGVLYAALVLIGWA